MYTMSDKYYRGLRNSIYDTKYKLQFTAMSLKINENKNIIDGRSSLMEEAYSMH